ncbi:MAG: serine--tRNA ligase [Candidatus Saccharimonadales bacterium]
MLDIKYIRDNPEQTKEKAKQKGYDVDIDGLIASDDERRKLLNQIEDIRKKRNELTAENKGQRPSDEQVEAGRLLKEKLAELDQEYARTEKEYLSILKTVPNMPLDDVPVGKSEEENVVVKQWGEKPSFDFTPKNHWQIGVNKGWIDKDRAAKVAGSRFVYLKGDLVMLEFALWQFALNTLTDQFILEKIISENNLNVSPKPFIPVLPPAAAKKEVFEATGRLNKEEQTYKIEDEDLWLNASAEHTLAPMYIDEILSESELPIRYVGYTTAFRREAGTYGKDMEGILRLHQFNKLEMECFNTPEDSFEEHKFLVAVQEHLMQKLDLPYQLLNKCTADIGFPNAHGMDIEVWLPGQNKYRETHTADYISDFQAQGMKTRIKRKDGSIVLAHTNDATAFSERPLIAIIENFQTKEGNVIIPEILKPYMGGRSEI